MRRQIAAMVLTPLVALAWTSPAGAQEPEAPDPDAPAEEGEWRGPDRPTEEVARAAERSIRSPGTFFSLDNFSLNAGLGTTGFTERGTRDLTDPGLLWTVRAGFGADQAIGLEAAYVGASQDVEAGLEQGSVITTGIEVMARVGVPFVRAGTQGRDNTFVLPYVGAGIGWNMFSLTDIGEDAGLPVDDDHAFTVPVAVGVTGGLSRVIADLRLTFRPAFGDDLFREAQGGAGQNNLSLSLTGGYRF